MLELVNCLLPDGTLGAIQIVNHQIHSIGPALGWENKLDARGLRVVPGLVNLHVHFRAPGEEHKETWTCGARAALSGGATTVADMPNNMVADDRPETHATKIQAIGAQPITARFWIAGLTGTENFAEECYRDPNILGPKLYLERSTGGIVIEGFHARLAHANTALRHDRIVAVHCGDEAVNDRLRNAIVANRSLLSCDHCILRSVESEVAGVRQALEVQKATGKGGVKMLFCHISSLASLRLILDAKMSGQNVFVETCPHYLFLTSNLLLREDAAFFQMNPGLRTPADANALVGHLCDGDIDMVNSDHAPHAMSEKAKPYPASPSGIPGVQELFSLLYTLVATDRMPLSRFIEITSANAACLTGMRKGVIAAGADADLVVFDPAEEVAWKNEHLWSKCGWSAFALAGLNGMGRPKMVIAQGQLRYLNGEFFNCQRMAD